AVLAFASPGERAREDTSLRLANGAFHGVVHREIRADLLPRVGAERGFGAQLFDEPFDGRVHAASLSRGSLLSLRMASARARKSPGMNSGVSSHASCSQFGRR